MLSSLSRQEPLLWTNPNLAPFEQVRSSLPLQREDILNAEQRWKRFARLLTQIFPELVSSGGIIESPLIPVPNFRRVMFGNGCWLLKADHALPIAGSIKARGGIYEVLTHAEELATRAGLIREGEDLASLASLEARALFAHHRVAVGSTGNLGLSIGKMATALGFNATVHMSAQAKAWKKDRLRSCGAEVVEHRGDYEQAVAAGRAEAQNDPTTYFVDDENSRTLFIGYSTAALRLQRQLEAAAVPVDSTHPLFVYLPCGVGGAPGGITFGLRHVFGDDVHCFFAEPVSSPCMLLRLASGGNESVSVRQIGLTNDTEADGLAVARASEFAAGMVRALVSGAFTVRDDELFHDLYRLHDCESLRVEPSAAAGFRGPRWILGSEAGQAYLRAHGLQQLDQATHVLWATGGGQAPEEEHHRWLTRGR